MKRDEEMYPLLRDGTPMSGFAKGVIGGTMQAMQALVGTIGHAADVKKISEEEAVTMLTLATEFCMSCCANALLGRPAQGEALLPDVEAVKAIFHEHFDAVIDEAATEGRLAIEEDIKRIATEGAAQVRH